MSEQNVELHRRAVDAFNARDVETFIALCDPQIELHSTFAAVGGALYHGHDGIRKWHRDFQDIWGDEIRVDPKAYFDLGGQTVAFGTMRGRGHQSGAEAEMAYAHIVRWRDGLMVYLKAYARREDALEELGVSEDALEPIAP